MTRVGRLLVGLSKLSLLLNAMGCGGETTSGRHQGPVGATQNEEPAPSVSVTGSAEEPPAQNAMPSGIDLLLLVDRAGIQNDPPGLFAAITESIVTYFRNAPADIGVALQLYSREEMDRCAPETYGEPIVPFAERASDSHIRSFATPSCIGASLPPDRASCLTLVSGCIGDVAYVGSYARGCESDAWIDLSCVTASGGQSAAGGGLLQADPSYEGVASSMGYLCACDPSTGQALGARLTVDGMTCEPP